MTDNHAITTTAPSEIQATKTHPMVAIALRNESLDVETMRDLMALQREWEANEAKREFNSAMTALKLEMPSVIERDGLVEFKSTRYRFATLARAMDIVTPFLSNHGFSINWKTVNSDKNVTVTCKITHKSGHSEETTLSGPVDNSGGKNSIQAVGSTVSYLQRYTALAILGIATADIDRNDGRNSSLDSRKNLQAVSYLVKVGITPEQAISEIGKEIIDWTEGDRERLKNMIREKNAVTTNGGDEME